MQLNAAASTVLVISYVVASLVLIVLLGALVYLLVRMNGLLNQIASRVDPTLNKADEVLTAVADRISTIGERTEGLLTHGEAVVETVHDRVDRTTTAVQRTINAPLIGVNSLAAGLTRGLHTFSQLRHERVRPVVSSTSSNGTVRDALSAQEPLEPGAVRVAVPAGATSEKE